MSRSSREISLRKSGFFPLRFLLCGVYVDIIPRKGIMGSQYSGKTESRSVQNMSEEIRAGLNGVIESGKAASCEYGVYPLENGDCKVVEVITR